MSSNILRCRTGGIFGFTVGKGVGKKRKVPGTYCNIGSRDFLRIYQIIFPAFSAEGQKLLQDLLLHILSI